MVVGCQFRALARGENCTHVHLARLIAEVKKSSLVARDRSFASGIADVLDGGQSRANTCCSETRKRIARTRSVARTVSERFRIRGEAMEHINGHEFF